MKCSAACYAIRFMVHVSNIHTPKLIYYAHFHSVIKYGVIFWGYSSNSGKNFILQKKIIRIMAGEQPRSSSRSLLKQLEILPLPHQYILSLMSFIINNKENFKTNSSIHNINTWNQHNLHRPNAKLLCFK